MRNTQTNAQANTAINKERGPKRKRERGRHTHRGTERERISSTEIQLSEIINLIILVTNRRLFVKKGARWRK